MEKFMIVLTRYGDHSWRRPVSCILFFVLLTVLLPLPSALHAQDEGTRYVRVKHGDGISYGIQEGKTIRELDGIPWEGGVPTGRMWNAEKITYLSPVDPKAISKVVGVAVNTKRPGLELPPNAHPRWFAKFPTSLSTDGAHILLPPEADNLNYEGELVVIIGRQVRHVSQDEALEYVFGYGVGNDYSENTWFVEPRGRKEPSRMISKGTDTWANLGRVIVSGIDYRGRRLVTKLNGEIVQDGNTDQIIQGVPELISHLSRYVTLLPGDVIFTGTVPFREGARRRVKPGDKLEVSIKGIGTVHSIIIPMNVHPWGSGENQ